MTAVVRLISALVAALMTASLAHAQVPTANILGVVKDASGRAAGKQPFPPASSSSDARDEHEPAGKAAVS
jgi:hypothetical protein